MKRTARNVILTILCGALTASAASCATAVTYPVTVDGMKIRAGLYILEQQSVFSSAADKLSEEQPDLDTSAEGFDYFKQTVEGKSFRDWINDEALEKCRQYTAVERLFDQYGLTLDADELKELNDNVKSLWTEENQYAQYYYGVSIVGDYYEQFGIGEQSFKDFQINSLKRSTLFDHLYGEGGELAATEEEINTALQNDYMAVNYFVYELENGDSAQSYADRIASGESYEEVYRDYSQAKADADAAAAAAAEAETAEAETAEAETAEAETAENTESDGSEDTQDAQDDEDHETPEEENAEEPAADETAESADTETSTAAAETIAVAEKNSLIKIVDKNAGLPSEDFVNQVAAMNAGDVKVITVTSDDSTTVYVAQKLDIMSVPENTTETVTSLRSSLKTDEFDEMIKTAGAGYTLTTDSSINLYKPEKLMEA